MTRFVLFRWKSALKRPAFFHFFSLLFSCTVPFLSFSLNTFLCFFGGKRTDLACFSLWVFCTVPFLSFLLNTFFLCFSGGKHTEVACFFQFCSVSQFILEFLFFVVLPRENHHLVSALDVGAGAQVGSSEVAT